MDWTKFNNHGESNNHAFEVMCNLLFEAWYKEKYEDKLKKFSFVNGDGGDGGAGALGGRGALGDGRVVLGGEDLVFGGVAGPDGWVG